MVIYLPCLPELILSDAALEEICLCVSSQYYKQHNGLEVDASVSAVCQDISAAPRT
jgi:hypothetical protein